MNNESNLHTVEAEPIKKQTDAQIGRLYRFHSLFQNGMFDNRSMHWRNDELTIIVRDSWHGDIYITDVTEEEDCYRLNIIYEPLGHTQKHTLKCPLETWNIANSIYKQVKSIFDSELEEEDELFIGKGRFWQNSTPAYNKVHTLFPLSGESRDILLKRARFTEEINGAHHYEVIGYDVSDMVNRKI